MSINRVCISGGLTRDPEMRATQSGTSILTFSVAVSDRRKDPQTGEWEEYPNYVDCVLFGKRAESLSKFLAKGVRVLVDGKLRWSQWERDGQKRSKLEVIVDDIEFNGGRKDEQKVRQGYAEGEIKRAAGGSVASPSNYDGDLYDEEIPF